MKNAMVRLMTFQLSHGPTAWRSTIVLSDTFPMRSSTGIVDMPIAISYDTICALDRRPPRSAYLLFDDQPASTMPYTPNEATARMNRNPIGSGASAMSIRPHGDAHGAANGITAHVSSAGMNAMAGARMNNGMYA